MTRPRFLALACLLLLTAAAAGCRPSAPNIVVSTPTADHAVGLTADGTATIGVSPDCADLTLTISRDARDATGAIAQVRERSRALVAALLAQGLADNDVTLAQLGVDPIYDHRDGRSELRGYRAHTTITATTRQFEQVALLMETAAGAGATEMTSRFRRTDLEAFRKQVRAQAIAAAQTKARETAAALGVELGAIVSVVETKRSSMFTNEYFPSSGGGGPGLGGDQQPLTVEISVSYQLR